ncbi:nucleotidyltransferase [Agromyces sp. NPDC056523]|uniref:nucleotidyltransferase domain-containing protein n=1 Tax=Agromyces sp. NPDC056523 TaxID=3345850 RepID=UPI0036735847
MTLTEPSIGAAPSGRWGTLDALLGRGLASLDITPNERDRAVRRYEGVGSALDEQWESTRTENRVFTQGSFRLGTETRRLTASDDIDIDCVALRGLAQSSVTQSELKDDVGRAVKSYASAPASGSPSVAESDRCWTLSWPGMHLDILPAIPDGSIDQGVLITDQNLRSWQHSNPDGYAEWFHGRMAAEVQAERVLLARALNIDDVPEWRVKTSLQRSVQALKRHRDMYFAERPADRPASIIITTLAALAYEEGGDLFDVLRGVTSRMPSYLDYSLGEWRLPNPVEPDENFADYWATEPDRATRFFTWMEKATRDFAELGASVGIHRIGESLNRSFGARVASHALESVASGLSVARSTNTVTMQGGTGSLQMHPRGAVSSPSPSRVVKKNTFYGGPAR